MTTRSPLIPSLICLIFALCLSGLPSRSDESVVLQAPTEESSTQVRKIRVPLSDLENLPLLASFNLDRLPATFDLALPNSFVGDELLGIVRLRNASANVLRVGEIKTSCGCVVAQSEKREISAGDDTPLLVKFKFKSSGGFKNSMMVSTSLGEAMIRISGNVAERLTINQFDYKIAEGANSISVIVEINDPALLDSKLTVESSIGTIKLANLRDAALPGRLTYDLSFDGISTFSTMVQLAFASDEKPVRLCQLRVTAPGAVSVSPRHVYAAKFNNNESLQFRLILVGDTSDVETKNSGFLEFLDSMTNDPICSKSVQYSVKKLKEALILTVTFPYDDDTRALTLVARPSKLKVANCDLKFDLSLR